MGYGRVECGAGRGSGAATRCTSTSGRVASTWSANAGRKRAVISRGPLVRQHHVGDPPSSTHLDDRWRERAAAHPDHLRAQILGVCDRLGCVAVDRRTDRGPGQLDPECQQRSPECARQHRGPAHGGTICPAAVDHDQDPFRDRAERRTRLAGANLLQLCVHLACDTPERDLAERCQVRLREEPVEGDLGPLGRVDVAMAHPLPEGTRAHVHELDLVSVIEHGVRDALVDGAAGDGGDSVRDRLQVLDVAGADDVDPGRAHLVHVLPALDVGRARSVGMRQLVDERDRRSSGDDAVDVHLLDDDAAILDTSARHDLEAVQQLRGPRAAVRLHESDDDIRAALRASMALLEHPVRLADPRRHAQVHPQTTAPAWCVARKARQQPVGIRPLVEEIALGHRSLTGPRRATRRGRGRARARSPSTRPRRTRRASGCGARRQRAPRPP